VAEMDTRQMAFLRFRSHRLDRSRIFRLDYRFLKQ
jgi:hypothetical protein